MHPYQWVAIVYIKFKIVIVMTALTALTAAEQNYKLLPGLELKQL